MLIYLLKYFAFLMIFLPIRNYFIISCDVDTKKIPIIKDCLIYKIRCFSMSVIYDMFIYIYSTIRSIYK